MKTYLTFMQRVAATAGPQANFTITVQAVSSTMAGQGHYRSAVCRLQLLQRPHSGSLTLLQLSLQLRRQPADTLHIVTHGTFPRPGLDQAEPALGSCDYGVYKATWSARNSAHQPIPTRYG